MERFADIAGAALERTGAPSIAVSAVKDGELVYARTFGDSAPERIYNVASVTKQFTAACALLLAREGKLSLDDSVARYFPQLTRADEITIRHLLAHTSGYPDYYPLGYADAEKFEDATPLSIVERYATRPLQFEPGSAWSYSNTGYLIAGLIIERTSGMRFGEFLAERLLQPAGMAGAFLNDPPRVTPEHVLGYTRYALGPLRLTQGERAGWMWAAGALACSVLDIAAWQIALMENRILTAEEFAEARRPFPLTNGKNADTALGWFAERRGPYEIVQHSGGIAGFALQTIVAPSERTSIAVFSNGDHVQSGLIANALFCELLPGAEPPPPPKPAGTQIRPTVLIWLDRFTRGSVDRSLLTPDADTFLTEERLADARDGLTSLGRLQSSRLIAEGERGGMSWTKVRATYEGAEADILVRETGDGRLAEFSAYPVP